MSLAASRRSAASASSPEGGARPAPDPGRAPRALGPTLWFVAGALTLMVGVPAASFGDEARGGSQGKGLAFEVTCAATVRSAPMSGRVYVLLGADKSAAEPRFGPNWFRPQPFFAMDVKDWKPGEPLRI